MGDLFMIIAIVIETNSWASIVHHVQLDRPGRYTVFVPDLSNSRFISVLFFNIMLIDPQS